MDNPCPPEVGLRMARLYDAIQASEDGKRSADQMLINCRSPLPWCAQKLILARYKSGVAMCSPIRVTVWNENRHEKTHEEVRKVYANGIHAVLADALNGAGFSARTATLDEPEHGLTEEVLADGRPHLVGTHGTRRSER